MPGTGRRLIVTIKGRCNAAPWIQGCAVLARSPWRTHLRGVSPVQPMLPAIVSITAHCDEYEILKLASAYFAQAEFDRDHKR